MIPTNARKKFNFDVVPSDRQLWAIGMVIVQWTSIEQMVKVFVHSFTDENDPNDPVRKQFDSTRSMQMRLDQWAELTKQRIQLSWQARATTRKKARLADYQQSDRSHNCDRDNKPVVVASFQPR